MADNHPRRSRAARAAKPATPFPVLSPKSAVAQHFDCEMSEMRGREYQPTRTPFAIWTFQEDYYTATRGPRPPKDHKDWPAACWQAEDSKVTQMHGNMIWRFVAAEESDT